MVLAALGADRQPARLVELRDQLEPHGDVVAAVMALQMGVLLASWVMNAGKRIESTLSSLSRTLSQTQHPPGLEFPRKVHSINFRTVSIIAHSAPFLQRVTLLLWGPPPTHHSSRATKNSQVEVKKLTED